MAKLIPIVAPHDVTVALDTTGAQPSLVVTLPKGAQLPADFVRACHYHAGEHGADIHFNEVQS